MEIKPTVVLALVTAIAIVVFTAFIIAFNASTVALAIIGSILGTVFMTIYPFVLKKLNNEELVFDASYILTMLISGIISTAILPLYFVNSTLPINNNVFIFIATIGISAIINYILNSAVSHLLNQQKRLIEAAKKAGATLPPVNSKRRLIIVAMSVFLIVCLCLTSGFALVTISKTVTATGNIIAVGDLAVYTDSAGTTQMSTINWGNVAPGSSVTIQMYVKNSANYPMTLSFTVAGFNPASMSQYATITWSYTNGTVINQGNMQRIDLTFTAANNAPAGSFGFNIIVTSRQEG